MIELCSCLALSVIGHCLRVHLHHCHALLPVQNRDRSEGNYTLDVSSLTNKILGNNDIESRLVISGWAAEIDAAFSDWSETEIGVRAFRRFIW